MQLARVGSGALWSSGVECDLTHAVGQCIGGSECGVVKYFATTFFPNQFQ